MGTHLKQRGKVFYFRRAVPFELQSFFRCTELWKSTGSSRKSEARLLSRLMAADFDRIVFLVKGGILNKKENRDALQEICDDFRREHRLDKPGVSSEDQEYIDDLTHRHLLDRLGQIDTTRSRGIPQVHCAFFGANEDAPRLTFVSWLETNKILWWCSAQVTSWFSTARKRLATSRVSCLRQKSPLTSLTAQTRYWMNSTTIEYHAIHRWSTTI
jgi:hypothetical protein